MVTQIIRLFAFIGLLASSNVAFSQSTISVPDDAKFVVQLDIDAFRGTKLGGKLLQLTQQLAAEEIGDRSTDVMAKIEEAIGFNPLQEVHQLTIFGSSFEEPEESLKVILQLGKTTGNLEGLLLALPGYEAHQHDDVTVHTANQDDMRAFAVFQTGDDGNQSIVAATSESAVLDMISSTPGKRRQLKWTAPQGTFIQIKLFELPKEVLEHDQAANIAKLLHEVTATVGEEDDQYSVNLTLETTDEKRAEQIQQLVQGLKALVGLLESEIDGDENAKMALSLLQELTIDKDGATVTVQGTIPEDLIIEFLRQEADLPL